MRGLSFADALATPPRSEAIHPVHPTNSIRAETPSFFGNLIFVVLRKKARCRPADTSPAAFSLLDSAIAPTLART